MSFGEGLLQRSCEHEVGTSVLNERMNGWVDQGRKSGRAEERNIQQGQEPYLKTIKRQRRRREH